MFKANLIYSEGAFRTPEVNDAFKDSVLKTNEKGPLFWSSPVKFGTRSRHVARTRFELVSPP